MKKLNKKSLQKLVNNIQSNGGLDILVDNVGVPKEVDETELEHLFSHYYKSRKELTERLDWLCEHFKVVV